MQSIMEGAKSTLEEVGEYIHTSCLITGPLIARKQNIERYKLQRTESIVRRSDGYRSLAVIESS